MKKSYQTEKKIEATPPVVVILGHVNHGKTSLLDYIRKTNVAEKESGKITQHIGAYEIEFQDKRITFIDTPGHEAFSKMRSHGAHLADIALLVIAANEGIKPQTKEALEQIKKLHLPYIIVATKKDLIAQEYLLSNLEDQLKKEGVALEAWGGDVPFVKTSIKDGSGINDLLETILILSEMRQLDKRREDKEFRNDVAWGVIIESKMSSTKGIEAVFLVKKGIFYIGDIIRSAHQSMKIKQMANWQGKSVKEAIPSQPISLLGFSQIPEVGEIFQKSQKDEAKQVIQKEDNLSKPLLIKKTKDKSAQEINLIVKTDVIGSQEAILKILEEVSEKLNVNFSIVRRDIGDISEFDLKFAHSVKALILGFRIRVKHYIRDLAQKLEVTIITCDIIYEVEDLLKKFLEGSGRPERQITVQGTLEVLAIFRKRKIEKAVKHQSYLIKIIIGGEVKEGKIIRNSSFKIKRNQQIIGQGRVLEIERNRKPVEEIIEGEQGGFLCETDKEIKKDDLLIFYSK